ncbi:bifunctional phosphoribosylaminoimidazolecarboxamide formyltransferase/IMP cyclohydrolase [Alicyclobacillus cycloheptanicus]|uniref:Bifunctional purine biosynthesis protein PurH n=1 Tax=Alicyclobacillus cycloheptanicus TaxID=1457 RepID=A0ABT9XLG7_9BACL|nr:bifunctional phosphoribosylaminoimidazolecarboxamide formyltransferase/IMP cyclohydrolase [Alicyclobacillus cycloheptanicus]MDQ0191155.1 phosphoribosylaminoimidazolecarboxamide formyltransferase/IMP cyclohydrolase [Alicyclobacillus cycloheptanicus]WDM02005.1 bifunctional phosphoribosylaminoimidazolecarboxamide formyltransferase/IMP cyclohydrolase [Alicyclobacillus cycloheptanicus]
MAKWALVSVFDKRGVAEFCRRLVEAGYGILSTGGTAKHLEENGLAVTRVEDYTGFPEMLDGRVKTLHPRIHGGLLGIRDNPAHEASMAEHQIDPIDVVVVNLYPFEATIARPGVTFEEAVEMIDIGGPSMLRAAAKNHRFCAPVVDPDDYPWVADALSRPSGLSDRERLRLAQKVFAVTARYDQLITSYLSEHLVTEGWPETLNISVVHRQALRYGENPHQAAHFYADIDPSPASIAAAQQLQGKELSFNNIQDADAALNMLRAFDDLGRAAVVAVKHMNPCGIGLGDTLDDAFARAYESDPVSIFGGIIACNRPLDGPLAERLAGMFLEIIIAPAFTDAARAELARKKNVRLLTVDMKEPQWRPGDKVYRRVSGGLLVQEVDRAVAADWQVVTRRQPTDEERTALAFAWRVVKFVKSNAIVLATAEGTTGIGAGQMNRVGAAKIAIEQAGPRAAASVLASDAFFPMRDTVDAAAAAGIKAIIQPGGSIKDADSIAAADEHGIAMVFTGERHFLH